MWLKRKLLALRSNFIFWYYQNFKKNHANVLYHFICLESMCFEKLDISKACLYIIETDFENMMQVLNYLQIADSTLTGNVQINPNDLRRNRHSESIENFFIDSNGKYINVQKSIELFKTMSISFANKLKEIENARIGIAAYNYRILYPLLVAIIELSSSLRKYQNE